MSVLGIDVGGTKVAVASVDGARVTEELEEPTDTSSTEAVLNGIETAARRLIERVGEPTAIGIGMPSQIDFATGTVLSSVNIPLAGVPLREEMGKRFGVPVFVDNDANCAALAEAQFVPDPPAHNLVMLTLGTGVGGGIVTDGAVQRGATGLGAEMGHAIIDGREALDAEDGGFPRPGSLEWLCSGTGLERMATEAGRAGRGNALARMYAEDGRVSGRNAVKAANDGDAEARELFERHGRWLGLGIAGVVNTFEPEYVVIGGGLSRAAGLFMDAARREAERNTLPALWERTTLSLAKGGTEAGVIGAGLLAEQEAQRVGDTPGGEQRATTNEGAR